MKLGCNLYVVHTRTLKQALNHGLVLKTLHEMVKSNKKAWMKDYIHTNNDLKRKAKNNIETNFCLT